tara:strand:- start:282 stop:926 length:645 start_codon:yes stop_codon:yes gene_type:complete
MATPTLNDLIASAISGAEEVEETLPADVEMKKEASAPSPTIVDDEIEKIASALEFVGRKGVENFIKEAAHTEASSGPSGTNLSDLKGSHKHRQVKSSPGVSQAPMSGEGDPETNDARTSGAQPSLQGGGSKYTADLSSNEAAMNYDATAKAKLVSPALSAVLDAKPFADPKAKEMFSTASKAGDKNIHTKAAHAELIREALATKLAESYKETGA